jgi:hypothetical protein
MRFVNNLRDVSGDIDIPVHFSSMFSGLSNAPQEGFGRYIVTRWMIRLLLIPLRAG